MTNPRKIAIVCNAQAGKGKALNTCKQLQQELGDRRLSFELFLRDWPTNFHGFTDLFLVGGDGTLNYFINRFPNISIPVSIFKGGSGNDFAWKLYGHRTFGEQLEIALHATPRPVDAGICNGHYFLNGAGIGFDGEVVQAMGKTRFMPGHLAYLWTVIKKIAFFREKKLQLVYDGQVIRGRFFLLSIANGSRYGGGFMVAPQAEVNDGLLDLVLIYRIHRLKRIFYLPKVEKGKHLHLSFIESTKVKKITIESSAKVAAHLDGEFLYSNIFEIEILPGKFLFRY